MQSRTCSSNEAPGTMKKNAKFSPAAKATKQVQKATQNEVFASLSADSYKRAVSAMSRALNPETASDDSLCTFNGTGRTSTVFRPKIVADVEVETGYFKIVAFPRFRNPIAMTNAKRLCADRLLASRLFTNAPIVPSQSLSPPGKPTQEECSLLVGSVRQPLPAMSLEGLNTRGCYIPGWNDFQKRWTIKISPTVADDRLTLYFDASGPLSVQFSTRVGSVWSNQVVVTTVIGMSYYAAFDFPVGTEEFGYAIGATSPADIVSVRRVLNDVLLTPRIDINYLYYYNSDIVATVEDAADAFICCGMSLWTQYTGSDLVNGGEIAGYRYPPFNLTAYNDLETSYQAVSSTPHALVGQLKDGAYGFYIPQNERELGYLPLECQSDLGCIVIVGRKASAESTLRINFNQFLVVSTTNQAFQGATLPADPASLMLAYSMLREASPVIKNDGHKAKISRVINWYRTHEKSIKQGLTTASKLAKIAAPVIGSLLV